MSTFLCRGPRVPTVAMFPLTGAVIDLVFANNQYYGGMPTPISCPAPARALATSRTLDGTLTQFGNDTLRIGVGSGLLVEDARRIQLLQICQISSTTCAVYGWQYPIADQAAAQRLRTTTMDQIVRRLPAQSSHHLSQRCSKRYGSQHLCCFPYFVRQSVWY